MGDPRRHSSALAGGAFLGEVCRWDNLAKDLQGTVIVCAHLSALSQAVPRTGNGNLVAMAAREAELGEVPSKSI